MGIRVTVRFPPKGLGVDDVLIVVNTSLIGVRGLERRGSEPGKLMSQSLRGKRAEVFHAAVIRVNGA